MKMFFLPMFVLIITVSSFAQEHYTENSVRAVSYFRTNPGQFDNYMKYLRTDFLPQQEEAKKQGLIIDFYVLLNQPSDLNDWDIAIGVVYKSFGDALDYNQSNDEKFKDIAAKHFNTQDEDKIRDMIAKRFAMRTFIGTKYIREIKLKPMN